MEPKGWLNCFGMAAGFSVNPPGCLAIPLFVAEGGYSLAQAAVFEEVFFESAKLLRIGLRGNFCPK